MGITASCQRDADRELMLAIAEGNLQHVKLLLNRNPEIARVSMFHTILSPLHYAALHGQPEVLMVLLQSGAAVDALNNFRQTPLMLACRSGRLACIERLLEKGANVLLFDSYYERTCLHYAAKSGHAHCLQRIMDAAHCPAVAETWGFERFINVRDGNGTTPLHLAARAHHLGVVRLLLRDGALVCATTTKSGRSSLGFGSTPLHFAARGGSTECVKELLAWGANRLQKNSHGHTPFLIARKYRNRACAALLNPSNVEPMVWPSPWKFMSNLDPEVKLLLEAALSKASDSWEERIFAARRGSRGIKAHPFSQAEDNEDENDLCSICFERACAIEIRECGHQMCAGCMLAICCLKKPSSTTSAAMSPPPCPFCRCQIEWLECTHKTLQLKQIVIEQGEKIEEDKELSTPRADLNDLEKYPENGCGSSSSLVGLMAKSPLRLLSSARSPRQLVDRDLHKESSDQVVVGQQ